MNLYVDQFRKISNEVLRQYIGVAAEFVVDDALKACRLDAETSVVIALPIFLECLANRLPQRLPTPTILMGIRHRLSS